MSMPPLFHGSLTLEREYAAPPARVFAAWTDPEVKARWFIGPPDHWRLIDRTLDCRSGGTERLHGVLNDGKTTLYVARYHEVIQNERLVYVYDLEHGGSPFSISLSSVEFVPLPTGGTRMIYTEHTTYYRGEDGTASRIEGTADHFDRLAPLLAEAVV